LIGNKLNLEIIWPPDNRKESRTPAKSEKKFGRRILTGKSVRKWVETKNYGLKIGEVLGSLSYYIAS
jgi:hypothetical protein